MKHFPATWKRTQLGEIASIVRGSSPRPAGDPKYFDGDYLPWTTVADVTGDNGMYLKHTRSKLTEAGAKHTRILERGTLILTNSGATLGVPKIMQIRAGANDGIAAFLNLKGVKSEFLYFFLQTQTRYFRERLAPGVGQPNLNTELIGSVPIALPSDFEQDKISQILLTCDVAQEKLEAVAAAKLERKRGLMQQLVTGQKRFKAFKGQKWRTLRLGDLLQEVDRYVTFDDQHTYRLASIRRRSEGLFFREALQGKDIKTKVMKTIRAGDFILSKMQVVHGAWGLVTPEFDGMFVSDSYISLVPKDGSPLKIEFLNYLSQMRFMRHLAYISSHGVHIEKMTFNLADFLHEKITIPPTLEEQAKIVDVLSTCDREIELLQKQLEALKEQKRGLMQKLLTGEIRVKT